MTTAETLAEALPREMARVRDEVLPTYDAIPAGKLGAHMIRASLNYAAHAITTGDLPAMIWSYQELKGYERPE